MKRKYNQYSLSPKLRKKSMSPIKKKMRKLPVLKRKKTRSSKSMSPIKKKMRIMSPEITKHFWRSDQEPFMLKDVTGFPKSYTDQIASPKSPTRYDTSPMKLKLFSEEKEDELLEPLLEKMKIKKSLKPFWYEHNEYFYKLIGEKSIDFLTEQFNHVGVCLLNAKFNLIMELNKNSEPKFGYTMLTINKINNCIADNKVKIISILLDIYDKTIDDKVLGHRTVIVINKIYKSIEFFDPNGYEVHIINYGDKILKSLPKFLETQFNGYKFIEMNEVCPKFNFQYYQNQYGKYKDILTKIGLCTIWSIYILHLRLKYYDLEPKNFLQKLRDSVKNKLSKFNDKSTRTKYLGRLFEDFIIKYMIYMKKKMDY